MSDSSSSDSSANPTGPNDETAGPAKTELVHVESPSRAPDHPAQAPAETLNTDAVASPHGNADESKPSAPARGTALVLALPQVRAEARGPEPTAETSAARAAPLFRFRTLAATIAAAALLGGLVGSATTAGISYLGTAPSTTPTYYKAFSEGLGRVDHELSVLKASIDTSTRSTSLQVAKITERIDRSEKTQADSGAKLAKASESLDRVERRITASSSDVTGSIGDVTRSIGDQHVATLAPGPAMLDAKRAAAPAIVDGWVLRDVYNGGAMIQGRGGIVEVFPGDNLPGLGRIESIKRQDGRWVVMTSRGLIVSR
jgi:hypothetical protein